MQTNYLESVKKQFEYYKILGDKSLGRMPEDKLTWQYNKESNSMATIVKHLSGNMISRWTDFLTSDGEKEWRNRDAEFENNLESLADVRETWQKGWNVFFNALHSLKEEDLERTIYIRNQGHSVMEAINRQLAHYSYHIGQMVFLSKMYADTWESLSIPIGKSSDYNQGKFTRPKQKVHFTDEFLKLSDKREQWKQQLRNVHQELWDTCSSMPQDKLKMSKEGKWSALQHLQHIHKGSGAYGRYLRMPKVEIEKNFGLSGRTSQSFQKVLEFYAQRLSEGVVSTSNFNPDPNDAISLENELQKGKHIVEEMVKALDTWTVEDMDRYVCPHPILGKLTAGEMLYFTIFHAGHHTKAINIEVPPKRL